jgi:type I restriction enzyme S subunit
LRVEAIQEADHLGPSLYGALEDGKKWTRRKVGDLIVGSRNGRSIGKENANYTGFVLSLSAVHNVTLDYQQRKPIVLPDDVFDQYCISAGDVFVSRSNTRDLVGLSSVAEGAPSIRLIYPDLLIKLVADQSTIYPRFLAYALRTTDSRRQIKERAVGTSQSMVKISGERLKAVEIAVPPMHIQEELIERFDEMHDVSAEMVSEMKAVETLALRETILRRAFAGEL